ncbi:purine-binding chemotaxis protein CheW [Thermosulfidibacter takaii ABI70S6]|uniref:Chemotaxis protein CheW n=1 Tax=Thermosulfidibacter takaii (strain DSM 17441 / JCM 13301 / NBRC 103674 / ABI70S6) TaxID=1298851 RepID=A0A0S3QTH2_THET7|nr:chemotaxis protein CheW [Thermosulfidibacter takaii]BAT71626.1 purine-binding chemotaxis protein CheW [Thermosulfidibacter takaii ABI70S6]
MDLKELSEFLRKQLSEKEETVVQEECAHLVGFIIGSEEFAVNILDVKEIIEVPDITRVPNAPSHVLGVINLRGQIVPVIDLRIKFNLPYPPSEDDEERKIVVIEADDKVVGLMVDAVTHVLRIPVSQIETAHGVVSGFEADYVEGIGKKEDLSVVVILNSRKLLEE